MAASTIYITILFLTSIGRVQCSGKFFRITKNDIPMRQDEPFLTQDVFDCGKKKSCTTVIRNSKSNSVDADSETSMTKTAGLFLKVFYYF